MDHGARGEASLEDARFVADLAASLGLPFDLGTWAPTREAHFEADARVARYAWLAEVARDRGASAVAVGHTRDDQAETILHRIMRGTGLRGLAGIPARRALAPGVALVRPLLGVSRRQIREELGRIGQAYREDATNRDLTRTRARIRHDLIPRLAADYNPKVVDAIVQLGGLAAESRKAIDALALALTPTILRVAEFDVIAIDRRELASAPPLLAAEVLRRAWRANDWPERDMTSHRWLRLVDDLARGEGEPDVGAGVVLRFDGDRAFLERPAPPLAPPVIPVDPVVLEAPGSVEVAWAEARFEAEEVDAEDAADWDEVVDGDRLAFPLIVRTPKPGDRFAPLGLGGRRQRLVDFLRHRRVPADLRRAAPVVLDREGIAWVVGHRIADRVRTTEETTRRLGLRWRVVDGGA